jgi:hypothetical protein
MKTHIKATKLRLLILRAFRKLWEKNPNERAYFIIQDVWTPIWEKVKNKIDGEFVTAVFASLAQDGYLDNKEFQDKSGEKIISSRITDKGLAYLSEIENNMLTRKIAIIGAVTGCLGVIISIIGMFLPKS